MNDLMKTIVFCAVAIVLAGLAWISKPSSPELAQFSDQGESFYSDFTDPLAAASLEVIDYNEETGAATPFKVQVKDGVWTIPSHNDYPADGEERLANTASAIIGLIKDAVQSDRVQDHETLGVIDPLDAASTSLRGRGKRVTLRDQSGSMLADFIIGKAVEGKEGFRYVRLPEKKRIYAVKVDVDLSINFADWIETNLLDLNASNITEIEINDYSIDESTGKVESSGLILLGKQGDGNWNLHEIPTDKELDLEKVSAMTSALSGLTITGVRPKPESLSADLRTTEGLQINMGTQISLQSKGFFISQDGRLLSNEGEVTIGTPEGVRYLLRFGEVLVGEGLAVSAGNENEGEEVNQEDATGSENRYLFVTAMFDETLLPPKPAAPAEEENEVGDEANDTYLQQLADWEAKVVVGKVIAKRLNDRFSPWYYVISSSDFQDIRLDFDSLTKEKSLAEDEEATDN